VKISDQKLFLLQWPEYLPPVLAGHLDQKAVLGAGNWPYHSFWPWDLGGTKPSPSLTKTRKGGMTFLERGRKKKVSCAVSSGSSERGKDINKTPDFFHAPVILVLCL